MHKKIIIYFFGIFLVLLPAADAGADVIKLKNGRTLEGAIISETKESVVIDIGIGEASINRSQIVSIEKAREDNAAIYYIRAINSSTFIEPGEIHKKFEKIKKEDWRGSAKDMEAVLNENQRCLSEIDEGLSIKKCDFYFEQKYRYQTQKEQSLHPRDIVSLGWMIILKGRFFEEQKEFGKAVDSYLSAVTFALQISQSDNPAIRSGAVTIEVEAYKLIKNYLDSVNVGKANCRKIIEYLDGPGRQNFTLKEFVEGGREWFMTYFRSYEHDIVVWSREKTGIDRKTRKLAVKFAKDLLQNATEMTDKYFGLFSKAAASNNPVDWKLAFDGYDNFIKDNKVQPIEDDIDRGKFEQESFGDLEKTESKDPKRIVTTVLVYYLSQIKYGIDTYQEAARMAVELKVLANLKLVTALTSS